MTLMNARYDGKCVVCSKAIAAGEQIEFDRTARTVRHPTCQALPAVAAPAKKSHPPTEEQKIVLELFGTGESLAIEAGAGAGKTSSLVMCSKSTDRRGRYLAFNKAIVEDSKLEFPGRVVCSTAHGLAMANVGNIFRHRLDNSRRMRPLELAMALRIDPIKLDNNKMVQKTFQGGLVMETLVRFCQSADPEPTHMHVPYIDGIDDVVDGVRSYVNNNIVARAIQPAVKRAWEDAQDPDGVLPFKHDYYLKFYELNEPRIQAQYILFDEAQDVSPVLLSIVEQQAHAQKIYVGDSSQAIYGFTGAIDALSKIRNTGVSVATLSQSFRFGPEIADVANTILGKLPSAYLRIRGTDSISSRVEGVHSPDAILSRTNAAAVRTVIEYQARGQVAALVGGGVEVVRFAKAADDLMKFGSTEYRELACFESWEEVKLYVEEDRQGSELRLNVGLVEDFGVETILEALDRVVLERDADVVVSTAHKSKGREWNSVQLAGDFPEASKMTDEELRLLYVACTRARKQLDIEAVPLFSQPELLFGVRESTIVDSFSRPTEPPIATDWQRPTEATIVASPPPKWKGPFDLFINHSFVRAISSQEEAEAAARDAHRLGSQAAVYAISTDDDEYKNVIELDD